MPQPSAILQMLSATDPFCDLRTSELKVVVESSQPVSVEAKTYFYRQGDPETQFYVLLSGHARLTQVTPDGHQVLARFVGPGECFGIIGALGEVENPYSIQAIETCTALAWDGGTLEELLLRYPRIALSIIRLLAERCQAWQHRYLEVTTERVEQRVARALVRLAGQVGRRIDTGVLIDVPLSREDLAEMTGTTLYTVSRILNRWEDDGLVELGRERVVIRDGHGLVTIAEA